VIDVSVPSDRNATHKDAEKELKYENLCTEIQRMWKMKCFMTPVVIGATETGSRVLRKYLEEIPAFRRLFAKKTVILGTLHITKESVKLET
jgi:hypothetical protein